MSACRARFKPEPGEGFGGLMRVNASEFIPSVSWDATSKQPAQLSAQSPVFVPGGASPGITDSQPWSASTQWEAWQPGSDAYQYAPFSEASYVDEESFLTPQLLPESERAAESTLSPKSEGREDDAPDADPWPSSHSQTSNGSATGGSSTVRPRVGSLNIEQRKLQWYLEPSDWSDLGFELAPNEWPKGQGVESPKFFVAGLTLRLAFFPTGTALTGEGDCAVALLCEEKAKLKFELFLNGRRSGTKVMLGQKFSCDFRRIPSKPSEEVGEAWQLAIEVYSNLSYAGFY